HPDLHPLGPGMPRMPPLAGVPLLAAGASLLLVGAPERRPRPRLIGRVLGGCAAAYGAVVLAEYATGLDIGERRLLFWRQLSRTGLELAGRASPHVATGLLFSGLAL